MELISTVIVSLCVDGVVEARAQRRRNRRHDGAFFNRPLLNAWG